MDEHQRRPISGHVADFIARAKAGGRASRYVLQLENRINRIIEGTGAKRLHDLDPVKIERFLSDLRIKGRPLSGITRNEYVGSIKAFMAWAVAARRIGVDPLASLKRAERKAITRTHPRRALSIDEVARLLDAAERRPLLELLTVRHGPNRGEEVANVRPEVRAQAERLGRERRLAYLIAVWTGLRRSEIKALRWGDIDIDGVVPRIRLRAETTKSRRGDTLAIHPQLADELRAIQAPDVDPESPVVSTVPSMKVLRADLKLAGIDYGDRAIGYADLHAQRKTLSTMMAAAGMTQRARQAHMRHTDPRLTENTYIDETLLPVAAELSQLPAIPDASEPAPEALPLRATGSDDAGVATRAANMQQTCPTSRHHMASDGIDVVADDQQSGALQADPQILAVAQVGTERHNPAPGGTGSESKAGERARTVDIHVGNVTLYH